MVTAIGFRFLTPYGYLSEAIEWVQKGLALLQGHSIEPLLQASAYNLLAEITENLRDYPAVLHWTQQSLRLLREMGNEEAVEMTWALWDYAIAVMMIQNDTRQAVEAIEESIAVSRRLGAAGTWYLGMSLYVRSMFGTHDPGTNLPRVQECRQAFMESGDRWSAMIALQQLGAMAENRGELDEAMQYHQEAAVLAEEISDRPGLSYLLTHLGRLQRKKLNFQRAIQYHLDYLRLWLTMGNQQALKEGFVLLAMDWIFLARSQAGAAQDQAYRRAMRLAAMAEKQRSLPYSLMWELDVLSEAIETCRQEWGEAEFQRLWAQGEAMSLNESIAFAYVLPGSNMPPGS
jgi:tetratricopeptide (TPR) repeat protein